MCSINSRSEATAMRIIICLTVVAMILSGRHSSMADEGTLTFSVEVSSRSRN